jgi:ATPase subunit of ABC transporter with duplicated ATPase domains
MGALSGGERSRAVLAGLLASAKNLLVLDEPTNHLDIPSAERLEDALALPEEDSSGFEGTLILISHDRALIDATCDHLVVLDGNGGAEVFVGGFTDWHERDLERRRQRDRAVADQAARREGSERQRKAAVAKQAERGKPGPSANGLARLKTEQLEARIEQAQARLREVDAALGDPEVWRNPVRSSQLSDERAKLLGELEPLEFEWARRAEEA